MKIVAAISSLCLACAAPSAVAQTPAGVAPQAVGAQGIASAPFLALSSGIDAVDGALRGAATDIPFVLHIDVPALTPAETQRVLYALLDRRQARGQTFSIGSDVRGGAAVVALACDGHVSLGVSTIAGVSSGWCPSNAQLADIVDDFVALSRLDRLLATRMVSTNGALSWTSGVGFLATGNGSVKLAAPGAPLTTNSTDLKSVGVAIDELNSLTEALEAVAAGVVAARQQAAGTTVATGTPSIPQRPGGTLGGAGAGNAPPAPSAPAGTPPAPPSVPTSPPAAPAAPAVPPTKPTDTAQPNPKLVPKLTEYATELATLKRLADEFNDYYTGDRGIWTSQYDSLREVWNAKADNTKHMDTK
ncbi:MAG: hypothetical protein ACO3IB_12300, partial [Phycisphaerales bacterium]